MSWIEVMLLPPCSSIFAFSLGCVFVTPITVVLYLYLYKSSTVKLRMYKIQVPIRCSLHNLPGTMYLYLHKVTLLDFSTNSNRKT